MGRVLLEHYVDSAKKYYIDPISVQPPLAKGLVQEEPCGYPSGHCYEHLLGLVFGRRRRCIVSVFLSGASVKLCLLGETYDLSDEAIETEVRTNLLLLVKKFSIFHEKREVFTCRYWYSEPDDCWPEHDIFEYVARITENPEGRMWILEYLKRRSKGGGNGDSHLLEDVTSKRNR